MKDNKVAILTTFYEVDEAYSLCGVVEDQIRMFVDNGYKIKVIVDQAFKSPGGYWSHPNVTYGYTPPVQRSNDGILNENWRQECDDMFLCLSQELEGYKTVITHDITLQPAHLIWNVATRRLAEQNEELFWLHWSHSPTSPAVTCNIPEISNIISQKFPHSYMCYPNDWDRKRVALNYGVELDEVKCVHHSSDIASLLMGDEIDLSQYEMNDEDRKKLDRKMNYPIRLAKELIEEFDILSKDVISIYPCRLDRGKQPEWNIKTMAAIKRTGRSVCLIIADFHSTGGDKVVYREEMKRIGRSLGLGPDELIFMSEWREETHYSVPKQTIMHLKKISDFHMHPSNTETYSLVVQESMITRNFCILNHQLPVMRDIYGSANVLYEPFGSTVDIMTGENGSTNINVTNEELHFGNLAMKIIYFLENNPVLSQFRFIRQKRSKKYIFKNELEPLLFVTKLGKPSFGTKPV